MSARPDVPVLPTDLKCRRAAVDTLHRDRSGSVAILFALMFTVLLGFTALATEVGFVLFKQRQMQSAASSAALGGATALMTGHPTFSVEAAAIATGAGFTTGTVNGIVTTVTVNNPPKAGNHIGDANYVEVIILQPQTLPLSNLPPFGITQWKIQARAVAAEGNNAGDCILQLNTSSNPGLWLTGGAAINAPLCGVAANSSESEAVYVEDGASLTVASVTVVGTVNSSGGTITSTKPVQTSQPAVADPYAGVAIPTYSGCAFNNYYTNTTGTLSASGTYCGGISIGGGTITMNPGVYILNGGYFSVTAGATVKGTGVTIVMTGSSPANVATLSIGGGSLITLSAPTTGATAGLVFFQDRTAVSTSVDSIQGGGQLNVTGAIYFPNQEVEYSNGSVTNSSTCTQLIASVIMFTGGASFSNGCASAGVSAIGTSPSQLVE